jgi:glycosyltransferase involved in cell wall biosynthesis
MRILVATDAWQPQVNGVVRTYERLADELSGQGVEIIFLSPCEFHTLPCPTYPEIRLAVPSFGYIANRIDAVRPDAVHIATEGPIGWMTRRCCMQRRISFTTSFHTRFPEYLSSRFGIPAGWIYTIQRRFHNAGAGMMVASDSLAQELDARGFERIMPWTRGVDTDLFRPRDVRLFGSDKPVYLYVGRVAVEKNIAAFLDLDIEGQKVVVGTGPLLETLRARYPDVIFTGKKIGQDLAEAYASADVFVFPSLTDTFGIVLIEAMAAGLPVAAFPVTGPLDNVVQGVTGVLDHDLAAAIRGARSIDPVQVRKHALDFSWANASRLFLSNIEAAIFARQGKKAPARLMRLIKGAHRLHKRRRPAPYI